MRKTRVTTTLLAGLVAALLVAPLAGPARAQAPAHVMAPVAAAQWGPAPPMLPPGARIAVLSGNPMAAGPYAVRLEFPANYDIPAHWHPTDENVVVVSGELFMGMGKRLDRTSGMRLGVGGYALMPARSEHFAYTNVETTIVLYGQGPVEFTYVNPKDDPRTATPGRR
ncbi:MAG: cupin domain-containing protein [Vicinamibacterales bacterium]